VALLGRAELYAAQLGMVAGTCCLCSLTGVASHGWPFFAGGGGAPPSGRAGSACLLATLLVGVVASLGQMGDAEQCMGTRAHGHTDTQTHTHTHMQMNTLT
jgi:hypothetical protein